MPNTLNTSVKNTTKIIIQRASGRITAAYTPAMVMPNKIRQKPTLTFWEKYLKLILTLISIAPHLRDHAGRYFPKAFLYHSQKKDRRLRYSLRAAIPAAVVEMVCDTIMIPGGARPVKCPAFYGGKPPRRTCVACSGDPSARKKRAATARRHREKAWSMLQGNTKKGKKQKPLQQGLLTENLAPPAGFEPVACRLGEPLNICHLCSPMYRKVAIRQAFFVFRVAPCSSKFTGVVRYSPVHFSSFFGFF